MQGLIGIFKTADFLKRITLCLACCFALTSVFAQLNYEFTAGKMMIKGTVVDIQTKKPLPMANVVITNSGKGITCDNEGRFTIYVYKKDTLKFSSVGYMGKVIHMNEVDSSKYYTLEVALMHDFIKLKEVTIYPYHDLDEFKKAFVDAKDQNKVSIYGIAPPKYTHKTPAAKFYNPISFLYDRIKKRRAANPDFKP